MQNYTNGDTRPNFPYGNIFCMHTVSDLNISVCIQGSCKSLYAYGDYVSCDPRMHTGIAVIPICIRGLQWSPYAHGDQDQSPYAYKDYMSCNPRMHTGISVIPICIRGLILIPVCIWELQGVIGSHHGESLCLFLEEVTITMSTTNRQCN